MYPRIRKEHGMSIWSPEQRKQYEDELAELTSIKGWEDHLFIDQQVQAARRALRKMMDEYKGAIRMVLDAGTGEEGYDPSDSEICDAIDWELLRMLAEDDEV
jgi:hypothetical protein